MSANLNLLRGARDDAFLNISETTIDTDVTIDPGFSASLSGPVTVPNLTVNGNLNIETEINVTGNITIGASGQINIIG
tara:strand:- start:1082 stop:1315 length:234 start_codon:yes stop_codon:yes gene_type:complete